MKLAKSDRGWVPGIAGDDVVTIGDPRLKAETEAIDAVQEVAGLLTRMVDRLRESPRRLFATVRHRKRGGVARQIVNLETTVGFEVAGVEDTLGGVNIALNATDAVGLVSP